LQLGSEYLEPGLGQIDPIVGLAFRRTDLLPELANVTLLKGKDNILPLRQRIANHPLRDLARLDNLYRYDRGGLATSDDHIRMIVFAIRYFLQPCVKPVK